MKQTEQYLDPDQESDYYDNEFDGPSISDPSMPEFGEPQYRYSVFLVTTPLNKKMLDLIDDSTLSPSAKRAFKLFVNNYLNPVTFFADNTPLVTKSTWRGLVGGGVFDKYLIARLDFELNLIMLTTQCNHTDSQTPFVTQFKYIMRDHIRAIMTRTIGPARERLINNELKIIQRNEQYNGSIPDNRMFPNNPNSQQKRSFVDELLGPGKRR